MNIDPENIAAIASLGYTARRGSLSLHRRHALRLLRASPISRLHRSQVGQAIQSFCREARKPRPCHLARIRPHRRRLPPCFQDDLPPDRQRESPQPAPPLRRVHPHPSAASRFRPRKPLARTTSKPSRISSASSAKNLAFRAPSFPPRPTRAVLAPNPRCATSWINFRCLLNEPTPRLPCGHLFLCRSRTS